MSETASPPARRFVIRVEKPWKLWIWPVLAALYFAWVLMVVLIPIRTGVADSTWALGGVAVFALVMLVGFLLLPTKKVKAPRPTRAAATAAPAAAAATVPMRAPTVERLDVELRATTEDHKGKRVLEASLPPKRLHRGAVYSKAYVPIDDAFVLRVEDLVAEKGEAA